MPSRCCSLAAAAVLAAVAAPARAEVGIQVAPRVGLELEGAQELALGGELRLAFSRSPLKLSLSFDNYFVDDRTLFQIGFNPLYDLPVATGRVRPYVGAGLALIRFELDRSSPEVLDDNGERIGLNLIGGVRLDTPIARPFVQTTVTLGEIDLVMIGVGVLIGTASPARER